MTAQYPTIANGRGACSRCGFSVRLKRDGTPQRHRLYTGPEWVYCDEARWLDPCANPEAGERSLGAPIRSVLDALYAARRKSSRQPTKIRLSEPKLRLITKGIVPDDKPFAGDMQLYGLAIELDDTLGERIEVI